MTIQTFNSPNEPITAAESTRRAWQEEDLRQERSHDITIRKLELDYMKASNRWDSWLRIPIIIIKLPVLLVMALAYIAAMIKGHDPKEDFWAFMR